MMQGFKERVTLSDFTLVEGSTADNSVEVNDTTFTTVYYAEFEKGEALALGQGVESNQTDATGRLYAEFDEDTGVDIASGKLRFVVLNRQNNIRRVISQYTLAQVARGASDESKRQPFPVQERTPGGSPVAVSYPYRLGIQLKTASGTANVDNAEAGTVLEADAIRVEETA